MHDGWETRRRRGEGHDWVALRLAAETEIERVEVDTSNFKGNYPDTCSLEVRVAPDAPPTRPSRRGPRSCRVASSGRIGVSRSRSTRRPRATHVRLNIHPDGGVARLRVYGRVTDDGGVRSASAGSTPRRPRFRGARARLLRLAGVGIGAARRPGRSRPSTRCCETADDVWRGLSAEDRREAFAAHPRIGERGGSAWARGEQAGAARRATRPCVRSRPGNREYEEQFGQVFLINATGKSAEEMLEALRERLRGDPEAELAEAAEQQRQITTDPAREARPARRSPPSRRGG